MNQHSKCAAQHFGLWCVEPRWFAAAVESVRSGLWPHGAVVNGVAAPATGSDALDVQSGIAVIPIQGQIVKGYSSLGGTSSVRVRDLIRKAVRAEHVNGIMLAIDSPGGTVSGTDDLARSVALANETKPVHVHADGMMASAALWIGSQARRVSASQTSEVGSIGVFTVVRDTSQAAEMAGVKVHVISTGGMKGAGEDGTEVTDEMLNDLRERVDAVGEIFFQAVAKGRRMTLATVKKLADGRMHLASKARALGLIDSIENFDQAARMLVMDTKTPLKKGQRIPPSMRSTFAALTRKDTGSWLEDELGQGWFDRQMEAK